MNIRISKSDINRNKIHTWINSFNEMITVLVLFFGFLFVVSSIDSFKYNKFTRSLKKYLELSIPDFYNNEKTSIIEFNNNQNNKFDLNKNNIFDHNSKIDTDGYNKDYKKNISKIEIYNSLVKKFAKYKDINITNNKNSLNVLILRKEHKFNIENMKLDVMKKNHFREFLKFKVAKDKKFRYSDFNRMTGISRMQWDVFRLDNKNIKEVEWVVE